MGNYYLYLLGRFVCWVLPLPMAYAFGRMVASLQYRTSLVDRKAVENNLKVILKKENVSQEEVRDVFYQFGLYLVDFFTMHRRVTKRYIARHVDVENIEYVNDTLKQGKGVIILSAHMGNWEMGGAVVSSLGYPLSIVALPHQDVRVNQFFNRQREYFGAAVIPTTVAVRRCLEHLKRNRLVAMLADRDFGHHGMLFDFLGKPTMLPKGPAIFSIKTGAPLVPCFFLRRPQGGFRIIFGKPIYPPVVDEARVSDDIIAKYIKSYIPVLEEQIYKNPTQWLMFKEFWAS